MKQKGSDYEENDSCAVLFWATVKAGECLSRKSVLEEPCSICTDHHYHYSAFVSYYMDSQDNLHPRYFLCVRLTTAVLITFMYVGDSQVI